jgi:hypothetical protein
MGSFTGFRMETTPACFHAGGKYCLRRTALNTFVRLSLALVDVSGPCSVYCSGLELCQP